MKVLKDFNFENYHRQIQFTKENSYYSMKRQKQKDFILLPTKLRYIHDAINSKEYYKSFLKIKTKKQSKIIAQKPKTTENPNIVDFFSLFILEYKAG